MKASDLHHALRRAIPIVDGDADIWALFRTPQLYRQVLEVMAEPYRGHVTKVVGAESRGFILGQALALELGVGFVGVRKELGFLPGQLHTLRSGRDYRGNRNLFRLQADALTADDVVVMADDWMETGNSALAVKTLVEEHAGARFYGAATVVDQVPDDVKDKLGVFCGVIPNTVLFAGAEQKVYSEMSDEDLAAACTAF